MKKMKFQNQPHFAAHVGSDEVFDTRFMDGLVQVPAGQKPFIFEAKDVSLPLPELEQDRWSLPRRIVDAELVNGVTWCKAPGSDGETYSGFVALIDVIRPGGEEVSVIRSWQARNETGIPAPDMSWFAEFTHPEQAHDFWGKEWKPQFASENLQAALEFANNDRESSNKAKITAKIQSLGLLRPWFDQTVRDAIFLENFASTGNKALNLKGLVSAQSYTPGMVYKVPETPWYSTTPEGYKTATCLGAISLTGTDRWSRKPWETVTIQWEHGGLDSYDCANEFALPTPLVMKDIAIKQVQTSRQVA